MARRYGPDGQRLWDGKTPEDFTASDTRRFINETNNLIESEDFKKMPTATQTSAPARDVDSVAIEARAYPLRVPQGNVVANANVSIDGLVAIRNIQILSGENGLFVGNPSKQDSTSRSGYRETARVSGDELQTQLNVAARESYVAEVEKLQARAAAVAPPEQPRIKDQLEKAGQEAAKHNAQRTAPEKVKEKASRDDR